MNRLAMGIVVVIAAVGLTMVAMYVVAEIGDEPRSPALNPGARVEEVEGGGEYGIPDVPGITLPASIGRNVTAYGVTVKPLEVTDDSRCPAGVACAWAGTVRLRAEVTSSLGTYEQVMSLGEAVTTGSERITLTGVEPSPVEGEVIEQSEYRFAIRIERR